MWGKKLPLAAILRWLMPVSHVSEKCQSLDSIPHARTEFRIEERRDFRSGNEETRPYLTGSPEVYL